MPSGISSSTGLTSDKSGVSIKEYPISGHCKTISMNLFSGIILDATGYKIKFSLKIIPKASK